MKLEACSPELKIQGSGIQVPHGLYVLHSWKWKNIPKLRLQDINNLKVNSKSNMLQDHI